MNQLIWGIQTKFNKVINDLKDGLENYSNNAQIIFRSV